MSQVACVPPRGGFPQMVCRGLGTLWPVVLVSGSGRQGARWLVNQSRAWPLEASKPLV